MKRTGLALLSLSLISLSACDRKTVVIEVPAATPIPAADAKTRTLETTRLGEAVDAYDRNPTAENLADAKKAFSELDGEIAELEAYVAKHDGAARAEAAAKHRNLTEFRTAEAARFTALQAKAPLTPPPGRVDPRTGAEKVEDAAKDTGSAIKDAAKDVRDAIKDVAR